MLSTLIFASCETYEYPQNEVLKGYFEESKGLFQASTDSIFRFSAKVNEYTTRIPAAKNDPLFSKIQENIKLAKLKITLTIADEWEDEVVISFNDNYNHNDNFSLAFSVESLGVNEVLC